MFKGLLSRRKESREVARREDPETRARWETSSSSFGWVEGHDGKAPRVSSNSVFSIAALWQGYSMISADVARMPLLKYRREPEIHLNAKINLWDDPVQNLVAVQPSQAQQAYYFWRTVMIDALVWNEQISWIRRIDGEPAELIPLIPCLTRWDPMAGLYFTMISRSGNQRRQSDRELVALLPEEVFHVVGIQSAGWIPEAVTNMRRSLAITFAAGEYIAQFFSKGGQKSGILEVPASMTKAAVDGLEEGFRERQEEGEFFRTYVLRDGAKWHSTGADPTEGQTKELSEEQVRDFARWLCLPPSKLGLSDSVSYNSRQEDNRAYFDQALSPWLESIASEANFKLLTEEEKASLLYFFAHDLTRFSTPDRKTVAEVGKTEYESNFITRNEYRARINLNPVDGGDTFKEETDTAGEVATRSFLPIYKEAIDRGVNACLRRVHQESGRKTRERFVDWIRSVDPTWFEKFLEDELGSVHRSFLEVGAVDVKLEEVTAQVMDHVRSMCLVASEIEDREAMRAAIDSLEFLPDQYEKIESRLVQPLIGVVEDGV